MCEYIMEFSATNVKNVEAMACCSTSSPFMRFYRPSDNCLMNSSPSTPDHEWIQVHETEDCKENLNPAFKQFSIPSAKLCKNNANATCKVELWAKGDAGSHKKISAGFFTPNNFASNKQPVTETKDSEGQHAGSINLRNFKQGKIYSMIDLMNAGLGISLFCAIDFTGSNIEATKPNSLHYMNPNGIPNQYERTIMTVGSILQNYDKDKMIPVVGFGATYPRIGVTQVSHCFPLDPQKPQSFGIDGVLATYRGALPYITFSGPTYLAPVINECLKSVKGSSVPGQLSYNILLILTDGVICDQDDTISALVEASFHPMSVILIGIGNENFDSMEILDSDKGALKIHGKTACRDIVQFVPFRDF